jgi:hypothetical protein
MHIQEQAFRAYYASMSDGDLLATAANRHSFVDVAQQILSEELARRNLALHTETPQAVTERASGGLRAAVRKLLQAMRHTNAL